MKKAKTFDEWVRESGVEVLRATTFAGQRFVTFPQTNGEYLAEIDWDGKRYFAIVYSRGQFSLAKSVSLQKESKKHGTLD